jgi:tetraacyldisaccharide 4'-kinase
MRFADRLLLAWYRPRPGLLAIALAPLALAFGAVAALRRGLYRHGVLVAVCLPVPVIVVGNIAVGGTGKTPLVAALAAALSARGFRPGCVSRGYGRREEAGAPAALRVGPEASADEVGDEPLLLARRGIPVAVGRDRVAAARLLLAGTPACDVVIADDGLQHYRLARDLEIAVVDAERGLGNGWLLPAGPLREPGTRLAGVDAVVVNGADAPRPGLPVAAYAMALVPGPLRRVDGTSGQADAGTLGGRVHAVAGIGNPSRFFAGLNALGFDAIAHPFPDHHRYAAADLAFGDDLPVVMTEKDAVKCLSFADERCWYLPVEAKLDPALLSLVEERLRGSQAA